MLRDRYGSAIGPLFESRAPDADGLRRALTDAQVADISHFIWDRINNTLRGSPDFDVKDVLTGDAGRGTGVLQRRRAAARPATRQRATLPVMASATRPSTSSSASCFRRLAAAAGAAVQGRARR